MKTYIHSYATISRVDSFENGIVSGESITVHPETVHPNYREYITPALIRRMSPVVKMGVTAGLKCIQEYSGELGGIVVGTDLGCLRDTEKFLGTVVKHEGLAISPTAFIQSTHNTVAGQIALTIGNNGYNMTHSQQGISFECALLDAQLLSFETNLPTLVGACEENIPFLGEMANEFGLENTDLSEGASYFMISSEKREAKAAITAVQTGLHKEELANYLSDKSVDFVLYASQFDQLPDLQQSSFDFSEYCGNYGTNTAFGTQLAVELLEKPIQKLATIELTSVHRIAVLNLHRNKEVSCILVEREA
ncbi:beta-ketoacyl synthase chain length factor [Wandonia haliotis]|uniref:Beta-ketoacyl synthase chain length factor n=1 Tax=Wandonia haliotis TaxID=574963 RepID=A0ABN1MLQ0_9FLAO